MKLLDKVLNKIGLVRKSEQDRLVFEWEAFARELSKHTVGVNILSGGNLVDQTLNGDIFTFGKFNTVANCRVLNGCVKEAPNSQDNLVTYNTYVYEDSK